MDFQSSVDLHNRIYEQLTNPLGDISAADLSDPHMADWKYKKIKEQIKQFEDGLDRTCSIFTARSTIRKRSSFSTCHS